MSLKKRIAGSQWANTFAANLMYYYMRFCHATTRWDREGFDEIYDLARQGKPVLILVWHERLFMSTYLFDSSLGEVCALTTKSRIAFFGKYLLTRFNYHSVMIDPKKNPIALSRQIYKRIKDGQSIVISPDGTRGPAREAKSFPVTWARTTQIPVFCTAYAVKRSVRLKTWDRAHIVLPFNRGVFLARRWEGSVPKDASKEDMERYREELSSLLNAVTDDADNRLLQR